MTEQQKYKCNRCTWDGIAKDLFVKNNKLHCPCCGRRVVKVVQRVYNKISDLMRGW